MGFMCSSVVYFSCVQTFEDLYQKDFVLDRNQ